MRAIFVSKISNALYEPIFNSKWYGIYIPSYETIKFLWDNTKLDEYILYPWTHILSYKIILRPTNLFTPYGIIYCPKNPSCVKWIRICHENPTRFLWNNILDCVYILTTQFWIIFLVLYKDLKNWKKRDSLHNSARCIFQARFKRWYDCHRIWKLLISKFNLVGLNNWFSEKIGPTNLKILIDNYLPPFQNQDLYKQKTNVFQDFFLPFLVK